MPENMSEKRISIDKANRNMFIAIAVAAALVVFSLVSLRSLVRLAQHRAHVIGEKKTAATTLKKNDIEIGKLITSFKTFDNTPESVIGTADKNSKIVLDSLPPEYDFPALATSLEKILTDGGLTIDSITGVDSSLTETDKSSANPAPVEMPFTISFSGPYDKVRLLPVDLERSIRPIKVTSIDLSGSAENARMTINAVTYYQPSKNLDVKFKEVK